MRARFVPVVVVMLAVPGCGAAAEGPAREVTPPPPRAGFDYQIGGAYPLPSGVTVVSRDRAAEPAPDAYTLCYVNAFQAQPSELPRWQRDHDDLLLRDADGDYVIDEDWDETLLDISTAAKRAAIAAIVGEWIDGCAAAGFDAVEPDNLDSYQRSEGRIAQRDALAFAELIAARAHAAGLAVGQKNTAELGTAGRAAGLDFAVVEECGGYDECGDYHAVYGGRVYDVEYERTAFDSACEAAAGTIAIVLRDRDVTTPGSPTYARDSC